MRFQALSLEGDLAARGEAGPELDRAALAAEAVGEEEHGVVAGELDAPGGSVGGGRDAFVGEHHRVEQAFDLGH